MMKDKKELPKYLKIEGDFRARIESGRLKDGDMLPDERTLAGQLGCNRLTVNKAYNLLKDKGYVHKVQGSGVYVGRRAIEEGYADFFAGTRKILGMALGECLESASPMVFRKHAFEVFRANAIEPIGISYITQAELRQRLLLYRRFLDGVIFYSNNFERIADNYRLFAKMGRPALVAGLEHVGQLELFTGDTVFPDGAGGGALAADYFLRRGHKRIAFVAMPNEAKRHKRLVGFVERLRREGLTPDGVTPELDKRQAEDLRSFSAMRIKLTGAKAAATAMARTAPPTALFCLNDSLAVGVHEQLKAMGVRCPEDVELLGCGGDQEAAFFYQDGVVPISTVTISHEQTGEIAARTLLARLENPAAPRQTIAVPMSIIHRQTTYGESPKTRSEQ